MGFRGWTLMRLKTLIPPSIVDFPSLQALDMGNWKIVPRIADC